VTVVDGCSTSPITIFNWAAPTGDTSMSFPFFFVEVFVDDG